MRPWVEIYCPQLNLFWYGTKSKHCRQHAMDAVNACAEKCTPWVHVIMHIGTFNGQYFKTAHLHHVVPYCKYFPVVMIRSVHFNDYTWITYSVVLQLPVQNSHLYYFRIYTTTIQFIKYQVYTPIQTNVKSWMTPLWSNTDLIVVVFRTSSLIHQMWNETC